METRLIQIGNSQGVRLPKGVIAQAELTTQLELEVANGAVIIRAARRTRQGWEQAAAGCHAEGADQLADWDATVGDFHGAWEWK
jgi:antitoxin MazE